MKYLSISEFPTVLLAISFWLERRKFWFIFFSAAAIIVFRAEIALLLGLFLLYDVSFKRISLAE